MGRAPTIDSETRQIAWELRNMAGWSLRRIARVCDISHGTVDVISKGPEPIPDGIVDSEGASCWHT